MEDDKRLCNVQKLIVKSINRDYLVSKGNLGFVKFWLKYLIQYNEEQVASEKIRFISIAIEFDHWHIVEYIIDTTPKDKLFDLFAQMQNAGLFAFTREFDMDKINNLPN